MDETKICPACGAVGDSCETNFHQMLFWEAERPEFGAEVHHLMVLAYHLQHPHLYSVDGLENARGLLRKFVAEGLSPQEVRKQNAPIVDSGKRKFTITARPDSIGSYAKTPQWTMTAQDVVAAGLEAYCESTRAWAKSIYEDIEKQQA
jgi:hypothetical protein